MGTSIESGYFNNNGRINGWEGNVIHILNSPIKAVIETMGAGGRIVEVPCTSKWVDEKVRSQEKRTLKCQ